MVAVVGGGDGAGGGVTLGCAWVFLFLRTSDQYAPVVKSTILLFAVILRSNNVHRRKRSGGHMLPVFINLGNDLWNILEVHILLRNGRFAVSCIKCNLDYDLKA